MMLVALLLAGCGVDGPRQITRTRTGAPMRQLDASTALRFGFTGAASPHGGGTPSTRPSPEQGIAELLRWTVPPGWESLPPKPFRVVNLLADGAECYVTYVAGGGAQGNINRWRGQMGADPLDPAAIDKLATSRILGRRAHLVDLEGTYRGMGGKARDGMRMRAIYVGFPAFALSIKMIGPRDVVEANRAKFDAFCVSLAFAQETAPAPTEGASSAGTGSLGWTAPDGWREERGSGMRHVTFRPSDTCECYILFLPEQGGGLLANVNRWRQQMGRGPLDRDGLAKLPTTTILGAKQPWLEVFSEAGQGILAIASPYAGQTLFVKMIGPAEELRAQRDAFLAFCGSLRSDR